MSAPTENVSAGSTARPMSVAAWAPPAAGPESSESVMTPIANRVHLVLNMEGLLW